jgi:hypothetical protein
VAVDAAVMAAAPADTAAAPEAAPDTGPTPDGATVERPQDGEAIEQSPTPDSQESEEAGDQDDDTSEDDKPRSEEEQKLSRSERRRLREQERINTAVEERFAERERIREAEAAQAEAQKRDQEAEKQFWDEFGGLVGTPEKRAELQQQISALVSEAIKIKPNEATLQSDYDREIERLTETQQKIANAQAELRTYEQNQETFDKLRRISLKDTTNAYLELGISLPPELQKAYLEAQTIPEALRRFEAGLVAREAAKHAADKEAAVKAVQAELEKERAAHAETRTGVPGAGPSPAGGGSGGASRSAVDRLIQEAGSPEEFALRAARGDYVGIDLTR